ncbi:MAG: NAD+ synthase [Kordiimonas sp.]|nr:NAD+ synthase [Kordiimonas sp.]|tara:strand:- start:1407 stop:3086 length:1680 start_codon:yes stop_codon:yes gene_type:complete
MAETLKIALATVNPTVGDIDGNAQKILSARSSAAEQGADLVVYSELALIGYPPEDLVLKPAFQRHTREKLMDLAVTTGDGGPAMLLGCIWQEKEQLYNAAILLDKGEIAEIRLKHDLPNYGVFDEKRRFTAGPLPLPMDFRGTKLGVMVCEDMWTTDVAASLTKNGAEILVVLNASPFEEDKKDLRLQHACGRITETGLPLIYVNKVGGQDELVFDGASFVINADNKIAFKAESWVEDIAVTDWKKTDSQWICVTGEIAQTEDRYTAIYEAMVCGLRDYVQKNHFPGVVLGMSGGIDSALSAAVAVDALGADKVRCVMMPSQYTSEESLIDAELCANRLGIQIDLVPIEPAMAAYDQMLSPLFAGTEKDTTEENIQARIRGILLMGISNKFGHMLLTTGNKSEMSVGYATLYGDMCGGYSVLKDIYKMDVFGLSEWRNHNKPKSAFAPGGEVIPVNIITKPPTAELRPDQKDEDSLPPYEQLDDILRCLIEEEMGIRDIVARGHDREVVTRIEHLLYVAEYKRRQSPPGVKITRRNFGRDRRYPITNGYRNARHELHEF